MARRKRIFTYEQALALLPQVADVTLKAVQNLDDLLAGEDSAAEGELDVPQELVPEYQRIVSRWAEDVIGMGVEVKGLWLVDFDSGAGYYCWRHPETTLEYFHGYDEGFQSRIKLN
ncbi:MAG: DUF2203 family protein [Thermoanaerobaculia bacterium]